MDLTNKLYIVTGAAADSDIGLAICQKLDNCGVKLILVGRREHALQETLSLLKGKEHIVCPFDLSELQNITTWAKSIVTQYGAIDGLVHSASFQGYSPLRGITPDRKSVV